MVAYSLRFRVKHGISATNKSALNKGGGPCTAWWWVLTDDLVGKNTGIYG